MLKLALILRRENPQAGGAVPSTQNGLCSLSCRLRGPQEPLLEHRRAGLAFAKRGTHALGGSTPGSPV